MIVVASGGAGLIIVCMRPGWFPAVFTPGHHLSSVQLGDICVTIIIRRTSRQDSAAPMVDYVIQCLPRKRGIPQQHRVSASGYIAGYRSRGTDVQVMIIHNHYILCLFNWDQ